MFLILMALRDKKKDVDSEKNRSIAIDQQIHAAWRDFLGNVSGLKMKSATEAIILWVMQQSDETLFKILKPTRATVSSPPGSSRRLSPDAPAAPAGAAPPAHSIANVLHEEQSPPPADAKHKGRYEK